MKNCNRSKVLRFTTFPYVVQLLVCAKLGCGHMIQAATNCSRFD